MRAATSRAARPRRSATRERLDRSVNHPISPEARSVESDRHGRTRLVLVVNRFELRRRDVPIALSGRRSFNQSTHSSVASSTSSIVRHGPFGQMASRPSARSLLSERDERQSTTPQEDRQPAHVAKCSRSVTHKLCRRSRRGLAPRDLLDAGLARPLPAIERIAAQSDPGPGPRTSKMRTARSRTSGRGLLRAVTPSSRGLEPPRIPGHPVSAAQSLADAIA